VCSGEYSDVRGKRFQDDVKKWNNEGLHEFVFFTKYYYDDQLEDERAGHAA
jgi:hypothetical protein